MQMFPATKLRQHLRSDYGITQLLGESIDNARSGKFLASWGRACYSQAIEAALCSLDEESHALLTRARECLQAAIVEKEVPEKFYFPLAHEAGCHLQLALCCWLLDGSINLDHVSLACDYLNKYFATWPDKSEVAHHLPAFVVAERFQELINHFQEHKAFAPPQRLKGIKCPGKVSFLIAKHILEGDLSNADLCTALDSFLRYQILVCLNIRPNGLGTYADVPLWTWIQITFCKKEIPLGVEGLRSALSYVQIDV